MPLQIVKLIDNPVVVEYEGGLVYKGEFSTETTYDTGDVVWYENGNSYIAVQETTGNLPTDTDYWQIMAMRGEPGVLSGAGVWETETEYDLNKVVSNGDPASSYFALQEHISASNTEPGVGDDWEEYWQLLAQGGGSDAVKCSGEDINTGTDDSKFATPKAIADSDLAFLTDIPPVPTKASSTDVTEGTDDAKFVTAKALKDSNITATPPKATFEEINTGLEDAKFVTPLAIELSNIAFEEDIPVKATGIEVDAGTDDDKFVTSLAIAESDEILKASNNLSDLADAADSRDNLGLGTAATKDVGTGAGEVPILGVGGKIDEAVIPSALINTVYTVDDNTERDALTPNIGDVVVVEDVNGVSVTYIWDGTSWVELKAATGAVGSVNGKTGTVIINKSDVGLSNVANALQLIAANNLSDLVSVSAARTNLGLGTSATRNTGTDENNIPLLGANKKMALLGDIETTENITAGKVLTGKNLVVGGGSDAPIKIIETNLLESPVEGSLEYKSDKLYFTTSEERKEVPLTTRSAIPINIIENIQATSSGTYYAFGKYQFNTSRAYQTQAFRTTSFGTLNAAYGARAFVVTKQDSIVSGGGPTTVVSLVVKGTSINDAGERTASDSEVLIEDISSAGESKFYQTTKRWIGQVVFETVINEGTPSYILEFNCGLATFYDCEGLKMKLKNFKATLQKIGGTNADANMDITLYKHSLTGWTYAQSGFKPGGTVICNKNTDYTTEKSLVSNQLLNYQRRGLDIDVDGSIGEGLIVEIYVSITSAITNGALHLFLEI